MSDELPDYERHPLDETVMGVQFEPLKTFGFQQLLQYWLRIRQQYPRLEEQPPLVHSIETLTLEPRKESASLLISPMPMSRFFFVDASGNQLIQIQPDRFLRNWRLQDGNESYPRFEKLFAIFWQEWEGFQAFLREEKIDGPKADQCELTYVNFIDIEEVTGGLSGMASTFSVLCKKEPNGFLPPPEMTKWETSYGLPGGRGRLHVAATPSFRQRDFRLVINFTLSARGKPLGVSNEQLKAWFHLAHEWIVRGFNELTTPEMHRIWGKKT